MRYRLGLDLGVSSIGSAVIEIDENDNPVNIVDAGVRIFPLSEGAAERREKRTARKNNHRTKQRLKALARKLSSIGFWQYHDEKFIASGTHSIRKMDVYTLRHNALLEKIDTPSHIGRIFMHLAKHRGAGYINASQEVAQENEQNTSKKNTIDPYEILPQKLQEHNLDTIGQYFYQRITKPEAKMRIRQKADYIKEGDVDYAIPRYLVKDEFNKIWDYQSQFYPDALTCENKETIYKIIFSETPPMPWATGKCIYIDDEDRLAQAHPLSEKRRIYESVHNIRIQTKIDSRSLTKSELDNIIENILYKGKVANKTEIKKLLSLASSNTVILSSNSGIKPYVYSTELFTSIPAFTALSSEELIELVDFISNPERNDDSGRLYTEDEVLLHLSERLQIQNERVLSTILTLLPKDRTNLGITATKAILEGFETAKEATDHRNITDSLAKTDERFKSVEDKLKLIGTLNELPYYGVILQTDTQPIASWMKERNQSLNPDEFKFGKIANPAVHMMLNQLRLVVNDIIRIYGKPSKIHIEVGRDVGLSEKIKKELEQRQKSNRKDNDTAATELQKLKIPVTGRNILKYKLAKQQDNKDAFNPTNDIEATFINCEVEHLIPRSLGGTDTPANLVLISRTENEAKGNDFPYEYFQRTKSPEQIREIMKLVRSKLPDNKKWRFEPDAQEKYQNMGDDDETNRYLTDTRYMSKLSLRYLRPIIDGQDENSVNIVAIRGNHTATLRRVWNCLLYTSPSPRDGLLSRMPSSA